MVSAHFPLQSTLGNTSSKGHWKIYVLMRLMCAWIYFLTRVKVENCNFLRVIELLDVNVRTHVRKNDRYRMWEKSFFRTRKPVCAIEFYGCTDYVLLKKFYIDFLLERIGTFKMLYIRAGGWPVGGYARAKQPVQASGSSSRSPWFFQQPPSAVKRIRSNHAPTHTIK